MKVQNHVGELSSLKLQFKPFHQKSIISDSTIDTTSKLSGNVAYT